MGNRSYRCDRHGGGLINAVLADEGLTLPKFDRLPSGRRWRPGFAGNVLIGGVTVFILAAFYSPVGSAELVVAPLPIVHVTIASLAGALVSGIGGARILTREVDKMYLEAAKGDTASVVEKLRRGS
jgi:hypothetical protein